jgi:YHS domain-containing protein
MRIMLVGFAILVALSSCNNNTESTKTETTQMEQAAAESKADFSNVEFASRIDTTCGMPIKAGVSDTLVLDGKVYGFCAKECKDDFVKTLAAKK